MNSLSAFSSALLTLILPFVTLLIVDEHKNVNRNEKPVWDMVLNGRAVNDNVHVGGVMDYSQENIRAATERAGADWINTADDPNATEQEKDDAWNALQNAKDRGKNRAAKRDAIEAAVNAITGASAPEIEGGPVDVKQPLPKVNRDDALRYLAKDRVPASLQLGFRSKAVQEANVIYDNFNKLDKMLIEYEKNGRTDNPLDDAHIREQVERTKTVIDTVFIGDIGLFDPSCKICHRPLSMPEGPEHKRNSNQ